MSDSKNSRRAPATPEHQKKKRAQPEAVPANVVRGAEIFLLANGAPFANRNRLGYFGDVDGAASYARLNGYAFRECNLIEVPDTTGVLRYYELASATPRTLQDTPDFPVHSHLRFWHHKGATEESIFREVRKWYHSKPDGADVIPMRDLAVRCEHAISYITCLRGSSERRALEVQTPEYQSLLSSLIRYATQDTDEPLPDTIVKDKKNAQEG